MGVLPGDSNTAPLEVFAPPSIYPPSVKNKPRTSSRVGDYVTAVHPKAKPAKTVRLYGFLELRPDLGLVRAAPTQAPGFLEFAGVWWAGEFLLPLKEE